MWIVTYYSNHLQKDIRMYFTSEIEAQKACRRKSFDHDGVTIEYQSSFELQEWEK